MQMNVLKISVVDGIYSPRLESNQHDDFRKDKNPSYQLDDVNFKFQLLGNIQKLLDEKYLWELKYKQIKAHH